MTACQIISDIPMRRDSKQSVSPSIPALICIPSGKTIRIDGKTYRLLKIMYDLKGDYVQPATFVLR